MSDLREQVAQWLMDQFDGDIHLTPTGHTIAIRRHPDKDQWFTTADSFLAVATPIIRAQVIEKLIVSAESHTGEAFGLDHSISLADWLRAQGDNQGAYERSLMDKKGFDLPECGSGLEAMR